MKTLLHSSNVGVTVRTIEAEAITAAVAEAVQDINYCTPQELMARLEELCQVEPNPPARQAMDDIVRNRQLAARMRRPMCQDTGLAIVFVELGQEVCVEGDLRAAIHEGVRQGYAEGNFRKSVVEEPLFDRRNTSDNTPAIIHFDIVRGNALRLHVACKGFGAENMSQMRMLEPADGLEGIKQLVVQTVVQAGPNACPPLVIGVGVGGNLELAPLLAKKALLRPMGDRHPDPRYAALEEELLQRVNATGIGPQGFGGYTTALDVRIEHHPTHIAGLPVAINLDCHLHRHKAIHL